MLVGHAMHLSLVYCGIFTGDLGVYSTREFFVASGSHEGAHRWYINYISVVVPEGSIPWSQRPAIRISTD